MRVADTLTLPPYWQQTIGETDHDRDYQQSGRKEICQQSAGQECGSNVKAAGAE
jgi:hypothetical protein